MTETFGLIGLPSQYGKKCLLEQVEKTGCSQGAARGQAAGRDRTQLRNTP